VKVFDYLKNFKDSGVLGINRRNAEYMLPSNPRRYYPLVDNKLMTKHLAEQADIPVPPLYAVIEIQQQVKAVAQLLQPYDDFVIKPSRGSGGSGILVIDKQVNGLYRQVNGNLLSLHELQHHVSNILAGMYSLGGQSDTAMFEYRVRFDPVFAAITYQGVPDIRVVVYRSIPVMAMLRLPTRESFGKANLHQGAIGVGIDLLTGATTFAARGNSAIDRHPDTRQALVSIVIPHWDRLLLTAARCCELTGLGYIGADFVLDSEKGPLMLELNARPGLNIQIANRVGLRLRLEAIDQQQNLPQDAEECVALSKRLFAASRHGATI
jgi:alpha-L-glutamate ligase-like protein